MCWKDVKGFLYTGWIKHNSDLSSNRLWRKVTSESASDNTIGSMCPADFSPVNSELVSKLVGNFGLCDKGDLLAQVKVNIFLGVNSLNFDQTDTVILVSKTSLVAKDGTVDVKLWRSGSHDIPVRNAWKRLKN